MLFFLLVCLFYCFAVCFESYCLVFERTKIERAQFLTQECSVTSKKQQPLIKWTALDLLFLLLQNFSCIKCNFSNGALNLALPLLKQRHFHA